MMLSGPIVVKLRVTTFSLPCREICMNHSSARTLLFKYRVYFISSLKLHVIVIPVISARAHLFASCLNTLKYFVVP